MSVAVATLREPKTIRERAESILAAGLRHELEHFEVRLDVLDSAARRVVEVTRRSYPDLEIPVHGRWGHFRAGGIDRVAELDARTDGLDELERARCRFDLVVTSVLLDAGAGPQWEYSEDESGRRFGRSEGLAVASFRAFCRGTFSSREDEPLRADADALVALDAESLGATLQVRQGNELPGLDGRVALLNGLGRALRADASCFGSEGRVGGLVDHVVAKADGDRVRARDILAALLEGLGPIWPGRIEVEGENLGDVWRHPAAGGEGASSGLVPFHKLSQWLSYSLIEPLQSAGLEVIDVEELTALAEYRNGGLLVDTGVLVARHDAVLAEVHEPASEVVVEWRALTVALIDRIAARVRQMLGRSAAELSLGQVLEGGTWRAGRELAGERRADGSPPIRVVSDGTVI